MSEAKNSTLGCRMFYVDKGVVHQSPRRAVLHDKTTTFPGKFSICLRVEVALLHGMKGGDSGDDVFWATLTAEDLKNRVPQDVEQRSPDWDIEDTFRNTIVIKRRFDDVSDLLAWLKNLHLEDAVRIGLVAHSVPSPERDLGVALFEFAAEIREVAEDLGPNSRDAVTRHNMCPWHKKPRQLESEPEKENTP